MRIEVKRKPFEGTITRTSFKGRDDQEEVLAIRSVFTELARHKEKSRSRPDMHQQGKGDDAKSNAVEEVMDEFTNDQDQEDVIAKEIRVSYELETVSRLV